MLTKEDWWVTDLQKGVFKYVHQQQQQQQHKLYLQDYNYLVTVLQKL